MVKDEPQAPTAPEREERQRAGTLGEEKREEEEQHICRYCLASAPTSPFISPCACKGSQKYVHEHCLRAWQAVVLEGQGIAADKAYRWVGGRVRWWGDNCCLNHEFQPRVHAHVRTTQHPATLSPQHTLTASLICGARVPTCATPFPTHMAPQKNLHTHVHKYTRARCSVCLCHFTTPPPSLSQPRGLPAWAHVAAPLLLILALTVLLLTGKRRGRLVGTLLTSSTGYEGAYGSMCRVKLSDRFLQASAPNFG